MQDFDDLENRFANAPAPPRDQGTVTLIVVRPESEQRFLPERVDLSPERGVVGDRWSQGDQRTTDNQVTLMMAQVANLLSEDRERQALAGDNFIVDYDLGEQALPVGTQLFLGSAVVEITAEPHLGCKKFSKRFGPGALRWVNWKPTRARRLRGVHAKVVQAGTVALGDSIRRSEAAQHDARES